MSQPMLNLVTGCLLASVIVALASCGPIIDQNRILGGYEVSIEDVPFQLALEGGGRQLCGASVLSKDWALTAAHCVFDQPPRWLALRAGSSTLQKGGTLHPVDFYKVHEQYNKTFFNYDVAVVRVKVPFVFSNVLLPVVLPKTVPVRGDSTWVSGWGYLQNERLKKPKQLMMIDIYVFKWEECKKRYGKFLTPSMMCAGYIDKDTCSGDSGGALVRAGMEQVGIVSWSYKCGDGLPSVYTNVSVVAPWIVENTRLEQDFDDLPFVFPEN